MIFPFASGVRATRRLYIAALLATLAALLLSLQFVLRTTGGTLFVFTTAVPALIFVGMAIVLAVFVRDYLKRHRLFDVESHPAGQVIFRQGDPGDCAYFIRQGEVEVVGDGDGKVIARLGLGEYFGEMALLSGSPRNATVRAATPVELAVLGKQNFIELLRAMPETEEAVLQRVRERALRASSS